MKKTTCFAGILCLIFLSFNSFGQTRILLEKVAQTGADEYDVVVTAENFPSGVDLLRNFGFPWDTAVVVTSGDTIHNFKPYAPYYHSVTAFYNDLYFISAYLDADSVAFPYTIDSFTPPTDEISTDGSITITFSDTLPDSIFYVWNRWNGFEYPFVTSDNKTFTINNMDGGAYIFDIYVDYIDPNAHLTQFQINFGNYDLLFPDPENQLLFDYDYTNTNWDSDNSCNGQIALIPSNADGDVTYEWSPSTGVGDTSVASGQCMSYFLMKSTDEGGKESLNRFIINKRLEYTYGYQPGDSAAMDTVEYWINNVSYWDCDLIDLNNPMDSVITEVTDLYTNEYGETYMSLRFTFYQNGDSIEHYTSAYHDSTTNFPYLILKAYCLENARKTYISRSQSFPTQKPSVIVEKTDQITSKTLAVIYPSPVTDYLQLTVPNLSGSICELSGKQVMQFESSNADIHLLRSGVYLLKINQTGETLRFIKQ